MTSLFNQTKLEQSESLAQTTQQVQNDNNPIFVKHSSLKNSQNKVEFQNTSIQTHKFPVGNEVQKMFIKRNQKIKPQSQTYYKLQHQKGQRLKQQSNNKDYQNDDSNGMKFNYLTDRDNNQQKSTIEHLFPNIANQNSLKQNGDIPRNTQYQAFLDTHRAKYDLFQEISKNSTLTIELFFPQVKSKSDYLYSSRQSVTTIQSPDVFSYKNNNIMKYNNSKDNNQKIDKNVCSNADLNEQLNEYQHINSQIYDNAKEQEEEYTGRSNSSKYFQDEENVKIQELTQVSSKNNKEYQLNKSISCPQQKMHTYDYANRLQYSPANPAKQQLMSTLKRDTYSSIVNAKGNTYSIANPLISERKQSNCKLSGQYPSILLSHQNITVKNNRSVNANNTSIHPNSNIHHTDSKELFNQNTSKRVCQQKLYSIIRPNDSNAKAIKQQQVNKKNETSYLASQILPQLKHYFDTSSKHENILSMDMKSTEQRRDSLTNKSNCSITTSLMNDQSYHHALNKNQSKTEEDMTQGEYDKFINQLMTDMKRNRGVNNGDQNDRREQNQPINQDKTSYATNINKLKKIIKQQFNSIKESTYKKQLQLQKLSILSQKALNQNRMVVIFSPRGKKDQNTTTSLLKQKSQKSDQPNQQKLIQSKEEVKGEDQPIKLATSQSQKQQVIQQANLNKEILVQINKNSTVRLSMQQPQPYTNKQKYKQNKSQEPKPIVQTENKQPFSQILTSPNESRKDSLHYNPDMIHEMKYFHKLRQYYGNKYETKLSQKKELPNKDKSDCNQFIEFKIQNTDNKVQLDPWKDNNNTWEDYKQEDISF